MSIFRSGRQAYRADSGNALRVAATAAVITGVVLLALIAFRVSYPGIRAVVLSARVPPGAARVYPLALDCMLVIAALAGLALHGAEWWMRGYAWFLVLSLLAAMSVLDAIHAAGIGLPHRPAAVIMAFVPWVLLLLGLGLLLSVLRYLRAMPAEAVPQSSTQYEPISANVSQSVNGRPPAAATPAWGRQASDGGRHPRPEPAVGQSPRPAGPAADPAELDGLDEPDVPAVRLLPPGPKPGADPGPAEVDEPDVPAVRLLPPGPKPGANPGPAEVDEPDLPAVRLLPPGPKPGADPAG